MGHENNAARGGGGLNYVLLSQRNSSFFSEPMPAVYSIGLRAVSETSSLYVNPNAIFCRKVPRQTDGKRRVYFTYRRNIIEDCILRRRSSMG